MKFLSIAYSVFFLMMSSYSMALEKIVIDGNKRLSDETIKIYGKINNYKDYDNSTLNVILNNLYETGFFENVKISFDNDILKISVVENAIIENIEINGVRNEEFRENLLKNMKLKDRSSYNDEIFKSDVDLVNNILKSNGFYFSKIKTSIQKNDEQNSVQLIYDIELGERALIGKIEFIGNKKFKDKKLREAIISEEAKFWKFLSNNKFLNEERINLDKRLLVNFYKNRGYYDVEVINSFVEFDDNNYFKLIFNVESGQRFTFNNINIDIPSDYNPDDFEEIKLKLSNLKGKTYSLDKVEKILDEIDKVALSRRYEFINAEVEENIIGNKLDMIFSFKNSKKLYVEKINIFGNNFTYEEVLRNSLLVDEGDPFNEILFNKSINNLKARNLFKTVDKDIKDGSSPDQKIIDIVVEEKPTGEISLGAGTGTSGSSIGGGLKENNFLGKGISLDSSLTLSDTSVKGQFIYSRPNFMYSDNTLFTSVTATTTDNLKNFGYKTSNLGTSVGTKFEQFENFYFSPELSITQEKLETTSKASANLKKQEGSYTDAYFNYNVDYDLRNRRYRASEGHRTVFAQELPMLSDNMEIINTLESSKYYEPLPEMNTKFSLYLKSAHSLNNEDVRVSKRLYIPSSRLRGFEYKKVGPKDGNDYVGGNYITTANFATALPQLFPTLETLDFTYFVDAANVWGMDYNSSFDDKSKIRTSTGLAMDMLTPIGPLSFSFAKPITKHKSDQTESFRFNIGTTF